MSTPIRTVIAVVTGAVALGAVIGGAASGAATPVIGMSAAVQVRGPGAAFAGGSGSTVSLAVKAGGTASFGVRVVNTGGAPSAFALDVGGAGGAFVVESGGKPVPRDVGGMYPTAVLSPGQAQAFTVLVSAPKNVPYGSTGVQVLVRRSDDQGILDNASLMINYGPTTKNTFDLYVTSPREAGYPVLPAGLFDQPLVGGPVLFPIETAPSITAQKGASFLVRLRNDGSDSRQIGFGISDQSGCADGFPARVTDAGTDVTTAAANGAYLSPVLASGSQRDLVVTVRFGGTGTCNHETYFVWTFDPAQPSVNQEFAQLNTNLAVR